MKQFNLVKVTSSSVIFSWNPPITDRFEKPILYYHIKIQKKISRFVVLNIIHTNKINEKEIQGLSTYTEYELSIEAGNVYGFGEEKTFIFTSGETGNQIKVPLSSNFLCSVFLHFRKKHALLILLPKFQAITIMGSRLF